MVTKIHDKHYCVVLCYVCQPIKFDPVKKKDNLASQSFIMLSFPNSNHDETLRKRINKKVFSHNGVGECGRKILQEQFCHWLPSPPTHPTHTLAKDTHILVCPPRCNSSSSREQIIADREGTLIFWPPHLRILLTIELTKPEYFHLQSDKGQSRNVQHDTWQNTTCILVSLFLFQQS